MGGYGILEAENPFRPIPIGWTAPVKEMDVTGHFPTLQVPNGPRENALQILNIFPNSRNWTSNIKKRPT
jgi:hypothetical protein